MDHLYLSVAVLLAYLLGSLSFAVIVSKCLGLKDPRSYGSKNPGATNVLRSGSKLAAVLTLLLDGLKGWLPVMLVYGFGGDWGLGEGAVAAVGLAVFMGHLYPVFFRFKGGKGVATAAGVLFGIHTGLGLATLASWLVVVYVSRYSSLGALVAAVVAPLYYLLGDRAAWYVDRRIVVMLCVITVLLMYRHRNNINQLLKGTELKVGRSQHARKTP